MQITRFIRTYLIILALAGALAAGIACGGETETVTEVQTVVVEKQVTSIEKVVETVVVEKQVTSIEKVVETVVVEKQVTSIEKVVETVVVERMVEGKTVKVVETVIVERPVTRTEKVVVTVIVEKPVTRTEKVVETVVVEKVVVATPTAGAAMPAMGGRGGTVTVGSAAICPISMSNKFITGACYERLQMWGFTEGLTWVQHLDPPVQSKLEDPSKSMLKSWELDAEANTLTWVLKDDIPFQDPRWGTVDAEDVKFSFDNAVAPGSTFNRVGQLVVWIDSLDVVDEQTVRVNCKAKVGCQKNWMITHSNLNTEMVAIHSKDAFDELGEDGANRALGNATGPFRPTKWLADEEIAGEAVVPHWRHTPFLDEIKYVAMPEASIRAAAFEAGEIHFAVLAPILLSKAVNAVGGWTQVIGPGFSQGVSMGGNYWATTDYLGRTAEGEDVANRPGYDPSKPWIGEWGNAESMEQALKVRTALAMIPDRDLLNEAILGGLGKPAYAYFGWSADKPGFEERWKIPHDPERAQELLAEAGYPDGFDLPYLIIPDLQSSNNPEHQEALAQAWSDFGINVQVQRQVYSAWRPSLVARDVTKLWGAAAVDFGNAALTSVPVSGAFNIGWELPDEIGILHTAVNEESDPVKKRALNKQIVDFITTQVLQPVFVEMIPAWGVRPEITQWTPYTGNLSYFSNPQTIIRK